MWGGRDVGQRRLLLAFLDALPANKRPSDVAEFECWMPYLVCYLGLLGEEASGPFVPKFGEAHRHAFHLGWRRTWETAARRYGNLLAALADCKDFLDAVRARVPPGSSSALRALVASGSPPVGSPATAFWACLVPQRAGIEAKLAPRPIQSRTISLCRRSSVAWKKTARRPRNS